jgi:thioredoxin:protein disulfide reductase
MNQPLWGRLRRAWGPQLRAALAASIVTLAAPWVHAAQAGYLEPEQAFRGSARVVDERTIGLRIEIAPGHHLYRDRISFEADGEPVRIGRPDVPRGKTVFDTNFQRNEELLEGALDVRVPFDSATADFRLRVTYQGCADQGLCYPPQTAVIAAGVGSGALLRAAWQTDEPLQAAAAQPRPRRP